MSDMQLDILGDAALRPPGQARAAHGVDWAPGPRGARGARASSTMPEVVP